MAKKKKRELLFSITRKDFRIDTFRAGGKGGQKQNKTSSGVRITHFDSGAVGESREKRSQHDNRRLAFKRCVNSDKFKSWHRRRVSEILIDRHKIEQKVNMAMYNPNDIKIETYDSDNKVWVEGGAEEDRGDELEK